jgi:hypothetical protein
MVFETNATGTFTDGHLYIWHVQLITAFGWRIFQSVGESQKS